MTTGDRPLVRLRGVALTYGGPPPVRALNPTDLDIYRGDYVTVVGRSGSGKSTLLNVLALIDTPTAGRYHFDGVDTGTVGESRRAALRARRIGLVFQAFHLIDHRTAEENVALGLLYQGVRARTRLAAARDTLDVVGLTHRRTALPAQMSGGERQRVAIARALVSRPDLLLCDEPTGNLDSATAESVLGAIDGLHERGFTVVVVTHDRLVADRGRRMLSIADGTVRETSGAGVGP